MAAITACNVLQSGTGQITNLLVAIPHLVGWHPRDSLVAIVHLGDGTIALTARLDWVTVVSAPGDCGGYLAESVSASCPDARFVLLTAQDTGDPAALRVVARFADVLGAEDLRVSWQGRVDGSEWIGAGCSAAGCSPHPMPDRSTSALVAHLIASGSAPMGSREEMAAGLDQLTGVRLDPAPPPDDQHDLERWRDETIQVVWDDLWNGGTGHREHLALVAAACRDIRVRDTLLWRLTRRAGTDRTRWQHAWSVFRDALVTAPDGYYASVAAVCGLVAWQCGDGARAIEAVERACSHDPDQNLAFLVGRAVRSGRPPSVWRQVMAGVTEQECRRGTDEVGGARPVAPLRDAGEAVA